MRAAHERALHLLYSCPAFAPQAHGCAVTKTRALHVLCSQQDPGSALSAVFSQTLLSLTGVLVDVDFRTSAGLSANRTAWLRSTTALLRSITFHVYGNMSHLIMEPVRVAASCEALLSRAARRNPGPLGSHPALDLHSAICHASTASAYSFITMHTTACAVQQVSACTQVCGHLPGLKTPSLLRCALAQSEHLQVQV